MNKLPSKIAALCNIAIAAINIYWLCLFIPCVFDKMRTFPIFIFQIATSTFLMWLFAFVSMSIKSCSKKHKQIVASQAFVFHFVIAIGSTLFKSVPSNSSFNIRPLTTISMYIRQGWNGSVLYNFFGNILLFVPIMFFMLCAFNKSKLRNILSLVITVFMSPAIECAQYITKRGFFDIDDIILNILGLLLGATIYKISALIICKTKLRERYSIFD